MQKILILIPCFNEEFRFPYEEYCSFFENAENKYYECLFVNDGSKDNTEKLLNRLVQKYENASVCHYKKNRGKAEAIRSALLQTDIKEYEYVGYFDSDLATPLHEINNLKKQIHRTSAPYLIIGSRIKIYGITEIKRNIKRHYIGRIFATVVSNMLRLPIYDTQCGAKLIQGKIAKEIFEEPFLSKWLFDVELLFRIKGMYSDFETRIVEVPLLKWEDKAGSKIRPSYFFRAPFDLLKIFLHYPTKQQQ